jgi:hypothetical protein
MSQEAYKRSRPDIGRKKNQPRHVLFCGRRGYAGACGTTRPCRYPLAATRAATPGWAEQNVWTPTDEKIEERMVDGARLELATSALRTRRSPN